ncbi:alkaline phosphatase family protein [Sporanaerobium hydrogeniformans]|uniref:alkaline phosphatase family protein n=1 Tax=Sporanaerobium hydrogeniformans TaxID=3072179 RepID=UPI0015D46DE0|nr:ectonucleotide pyrophosphatase/phosphodiesterase [Sporanaerobium hydrogeniformans]
MSKVLVISLDAVSDETFDILKEYRHFKTLYRESTLVREVDSLFLSNTYPIHTSVATGTYPYEHGVFSNTKVQPGNNHPDWLCFSQFIKAKTLWQAANEKQLKTAAVMWPVTGGAKEIAYNVPEIMAKPRESQMIVSLRAGSKFLQLKEFLRHKKVLKGIQQPQLDQFSTLVMCDIIKEKQPDLMLLHLTAYDSLCHQYGKDSKKLKEAYEALDANLGKLLAVIDEETTVIFFSDHGQLNVHQCIQPNIYLRERGISEEEAYIECCGGSAFFHAYNCSEATVVQMKEHLRGTQGFNRFLTTEEMQLCGRGDLPFGFCAKVGYFYERREIQEKGNHGYPLDYPHYKVFYGVRGKRFEQGKVLKGGSLLDLTALIAKECELDMPDIKGKIKENIYKERVL